MNVIRIYGGLGNQLFQYALGRAMEVNGIKVGYDIFHRRYTSPNEFTRKYLLNKFCVAVKKVPFLRQNTIRERNFTLEVVKKDNHNFWGYWQRPGIHENILSILRKEFCVKEEFYTPEFLDLKERIVNSNSVSIHVRRGDYLTNDGFNVLPLSYYQKAIKQIEGVKFLYIFSDDIKWCKENFEEGVFVHLEEYLDFELMKSCKSNIIANSTFSWWAAYLNDNPKKIVIAPKQWRARISDQEIFDKDFFLPKDWILL